VSNTHLDQAVSRLRNGTHNEVARAAVEASLAVAYEQRTASLIALYESVPMPRLGSDTQALRAQIMERLDLA
jgi:hypothetical protein